mgnify:CR=1 FL=1
MKTLTAILALFLFSLTPATAADHAADDVSVGDITVSNAWARATIGSKRPGGAYLALANAGSTSDHLIAAETTVAGKSELHTHTMADGVMKMSQVKSIEIPAGGMAMLQPGGFHIMMFDLKAALAEGTMFPLTLTFEKAGKVTITVHVGKVGAMMGHDHSAEHMKNMEPQKHMDDDEHKKMHDKHMKEGATPAQ